MISTSCQAALRDRILHTDAFMDSPRTGRTGARARADAGRDGSAVLEAHGAARRGGCLLHGIFPRPRHVASGETHSSIRAGESNGPARGRADDRQRHRGAGADGEGTPTTAPRGRGPEPRLSCAHRVQKMRGRRPASRTGARGRHPRRVARGDSTAVPFHGEDAPRLRHDGRL